MPQTANQKIRNADLYAAIKGYVEAALALIATRSDRNEQVTFETTTWEPAGSDLFVQRIVEAHSWSDCISRHLQDLHSLSAYRTLLEVLHAEGAIRHQLTVPSGSIYPWIRYTLPRKLRCIHHQ